ncbi:DUF6602 domain-containing protein [uncultured Methylobacterium sp.]|jgi:hypothetical protein|uniref:DUF6602 domain-containing protein n=1 Tax=uncultured Methylobacterium sp. TaxID=157278 RepID=UPI00260DEB70|nr:DUF6602 domain-containing protein [uncultured Methylobacterium sp.]
MIARARGVLEAARSLGVDGHAGVRGTIRELLTIQLLEPILPPGAKIGTGHLITVDGNLSAQTDIAIYAPSVMMPSLFERTGFFPIESCLYALEVKSRLTVGGLKNTLESASKVRALPLVATDHWGVAADRNPPIDSVRTRTALPVNALFAFSSDLTGDPIDEMRRCRRLDPCFATLPSLQAICIIGRGYWYFSNDEGWRHVSATDDLDELMSFLAGIVNTLPQLIAAKGRPKFGAYLEKSGNTHHILINEGFP